MIVNNYYSKNGGTNLKKLLIATNNKGKLKELKEMLLGYEILSLEDVGCRVNIEENGSTFEENAKKKAKGFFESTKIPCIADDSGLCIETLDGWPGIFTARFLGENATKDERNNYILEKMKNIKDYKRKAFVKCAIAYYDGKNFIIVKGSIEGKIALDKRGNNGFGFDEIFELPNGKTYAELSKEEKNEISHRKIAIKDLIKKLKKLY